MPDNQVAIIPDFRDLANLVSTFAIPLVPPLLEINPITPPNKRVNTIIWMCETSLIALITYLSASRSNPVKGL